MQLDCRKASAGPAVHLRSDFSNAPYFVRVTVIEDADVEDQHCSAHRHYTGPTERPRKVIPPR